MNYKLKFRKRDDHLLAYIRALEMSREISHAYMLEMHDKCIELGARRLLVIRDVPHVLSTIDFYNVSKNSVELLKGIKTAWVNPFPPLRPTLEFAVTVANNRGACYGLFSDVQQATRWLSGSTIAERCPS